MYHSLQRFLHELPCPCRPSSCHISRNNLNNGRTSPGGTACPGVSASPAGLDSSRDGPSKVSSLSLRPSYFVSSLEKDSKEWVWRFFADKNGLKEDRQRESGGLAAHRFAFPPFLYDSGGPVVLLFFLMLSLLSVSYYRTLVFTRHRNNISTPLHVPVARLPTPNMGWGHRHTYTNTWTHLSVSQCISPALGGKDSKERDASTRKQAGCCDADRTGQTVRWRKEKRKGREGR